MGLFFVLILFSHYAHFSIVASWSLDHISLSPSPAPGPSLAPKIQPSQVVFDVRSFGGVGDGVTDDTQAFKMAWDSACQSDEPSTLLVPKHYTFLIQSTIFTGSCGNRVVFEVIIYN